MNHSNYIRTMKEVYGVDFHDVWRQAISHKSDYDKKRATDDAVEAEFWKSYSKKYDQIPSLMDYAPEVLERLLGIVGVNKELIEFGCGTGKFTLPMASKSKSILAVDFSEDMLKNLRHKLVATAVKNVHLIHDKFELAKLKKADVVYGINANYRMLDIKQAVEKMQQLAREKVVLVWTMQRSPYDAILSKTSVKGIGRGQEYIQLLNILYEMGIDPSVDMMTVNKPIPVEKVEVHYENLENLAKMYDLDRDFLIESFNKCLYKNEAGLIFNCALKVVIIHFEAYG